MGGALECGRAVEHRLDFVDAKDVSQTIGAEEVKVAGLVEGDGHFGLYFGSGAYCAGDHIFIPERGLLSLFSQFSAFDPAGEERVVFGEEFECLFAKAVDAAVADVGIDDGLRSPEEAAEGCSHASEQV